MVYGDFKNLNRRTAADKVLVIKHLISQKVQWKSAWTCFNGL